MNLKPKIEEAAAELEKAVSDLLKLSKKQAKEMEDATRKVNMAQARLMAQLAMLES